MLSTPRHRCGGEVSTTPLPKFILPAPADRLVVTIHFSESMSIGADLRTSPLDGWERDLPMTEPAGPTSSGPVHRSIAERLNRLFAAIRPPGEDREYQGKEVVAAIRAVGGEMSESYLSELRRGIKPNPTIRHLDALAEFFGVRTGYFTDDLVAEEVEAEFELRIAMHKSNVKDLALRVAGLDPLERAAMNRLLAQIISEHGEP